MISLPSRSISIRPAHRALLAALLLGVAVVPAMAQGMAAAPAGLQPAMHHGTGHGMDSRGGAQTMMSGRLLDAVGASAEQKARIQQIMGQAHDDMVKQRDADRALRQQMMAVMAAPQIDAAAAETLRQQLQARHDAASKRHLQAMLDAGAVLTPEQRAKLAERMKSRQEMMDRHHSERGAADTRG